MANTANRTLHLRLPLLLLVAAADTFTGGSADELQLPITRPHCQDKCGNISIPYPFGINAGCFHPGFEVVCNGTFDPPRLFLAADQPITEGNTATRPYLSVSDYYYTRTNKQLSQLTLIENFQLPVELIDISVSQGQMRILGAFSFDCRENATYNSFRVQTMFLPPSTPFLLSQESNVLLVIGRKVQATMDLDCSKLTVRTAGRCLGKGWCKGDIQVNTHGSKVEISLGGGAGEAEWRSSPCSYGMVVDNSSYSFSDEDLAGDSFLRRNEERGVPIVLHFAIREVECPAEGEPEPSGYTSVSNHSECVDGPILPSHYCTCSSGFQGNPYIANGCQDIDECKHPNLYPCHGKCKNKPGDYDCTCPPGMRGDAKAGPCTEIFPLAAKVSLGNINTYQAIVYDSTFVEPGFSPQPNAWCHVQ